MSLDSFFPYFSVLLLIPWASKMNDFVFFILSKNILSCLWATNKCDIHCKSTPRTPSIVIVVFTAKCVVQIAPVLLSFSALFLLKNVFWLSKTNQRGNARMLYVWDLNERVYQNKRQIFFYYHSQWMQHKERNRFIGEFQEDNKTMNVENERTTILTNVQCTH